MTQKSIKSIWVMILCPFFLSVCLSSCIKIGPSLAKMTPQTSTSMIIFSGMTRNYSGAHGVLNIYVGPDVFPNEIDLTIPTDEAAQSTSNLWLMIVGKPETYTSIQIQMGQTIIFEGYQIKVLRIASDASGNGFVELDVANA